MRRFRHPHAPGSTRQDRIYWRRRQDRLAVSQEAADALAHVTQANVFQQEAITEFVDTCVADGNWANIVDGGELWVCGIAVGGTGAGSSYSGLISGTQATPGVNTSQSELGWVVGAQAVEDATYRVATGYTIPSGMLDDIVIGAYVQDYTDHPAGYHPLIGANDGTNNTGISTFDTNGGQARSYLNMTGVGTRVSVDTLWANWPGTYWEAQRRESTIQWSYKDGVYAQDTPGASVAVPTTEVNVGGWPGREQFNGTVGVAYIAKYHGDTTWDVAAFNAALVTLIAAVEGS